jgi:hypothetical protein
MDLHNATSVLIKEHAVKHIENESIVEVVTGVIDALAILAAGFTNDAKAAIVLALVKQMDYESKRFDAYQAELEAARAIDRASTE